MKSNSIPVDYAANWLCQMAAADGVISPRERKLLQEFAKHYGLDVNQLYRRAYGMLKHHSTPEVEAVDACALAGRQFEEFVVSLCSDKSRFKLIAWRGDKISGTTYALENLLPDLHIRHRLDPNIEVEYFIECKYRSSWGDGSLDFSKQFSRYHREAKERNMQLFIALGIGGSPSNPEEFYLIPGRMVGLDKKIERDGYFQKCRCNPDPEILHNYITHYYSKRVLK